MRFSNNRLSKTGKSFLIDDRIFSIMDYESNERVENDSSALIVFITIIAIAVSLLGIMVSIR